MSQPTATVASMRSRSALLITVGLALWVLSLAPWSFSVGEESALVDLTLYVSLFVSTAGALLALIGVRRLLRQVQPRLAEPGTTPSAAGVTAGPVTTSHRRRITASSLITAGVLLYLAAEIAYWLLPTSGGIALDLLYGATFIAGYAGPALALVGLYRVLRRVDQLVAAR